MDKAKGHIGDIDTGFLNELPCLFVDVLYGSKRIYSIVQQNLVLAFDFSRVQGKEFCPCFRGIRLF